MRAGSEMVRCKGSKGEIRNKTLLNFVLWEMDRGETFWYDLTSSENLCLTQALFIHKIISSYTIIIDYKPFHGTHFF